MFDFEWVDANLYSGLYTRTKSFFDEFGALLHRPSGERGGARSARAFPRRGARGHSRRPLDAAGP